MSSLDAALRALDTDPLGQHLAAMVDAPAASARRFYAAAHIVMQASYAEVPEQHSAPFDPGELAAHIDWDATLGLRRFLDGHGLGLAEAMDTAQRFELGWELASTLIQKAGGLGLREGFVAGAGVDHLAGELDEDALVAGVIFQARFIQDTGGIPILLPLVALPQRSAQEHDYVTHYTRVIDALEGPLLVHWLGEVFHPGLRGYFPGASFARILAHDPAKVRGCKLSLLDADLERRVRAELTPRDQVVLTGDDHHFADLIVEGGAPAARASDLGGRTLAIGPFSHALLGVLEGIARPAGLALRALGEGDAALARELLVPCEEYGRHVFCAPTPHYKAGLAFTAYLAGLQDNALLPGRLDLSRDRQHQLRVAELAARAGAFEDRALAAERLRAWSAESRRTSRRPMP
ncbi:MAG: DUF993 family protein [Planctomycetota bacterium]|nr:DUF993 family protein [Planctomycetota bacterium]